MKYSSVNELDHFSFHDAVLKEIEYKNRNIKWILDAVNAITENSQNSYPTDMCIKDAEIIFENAQIIEIEFNAFKVFDNNNVLIRSVEAQKAKSEEYDTILRDSLNSYCYILSFDNILQDENGIYIVCFNIDGGAGCYDLELKFTKSIVSWNEFRGKAWYEDEKWKKH